MTDGSPRATSSWAKLREDRASRHPQPRSRRPCMNSPSSWRALWRISSVKDRSDRGSCITVRLGEEVSVDAKSPGSIRVAQSAVDSPHWNAFSEQARGGEKPEIVKPDRFQIRGSANSNRPFRDFIRYPRSTADRIKREDVRRFTERRSMGNCSLYTVLVMALEFGDRSPVECYSSRRVRLGVLFNQLRP